MAVFCGRDSGGRGEGVMMSSWVVLSDTAFILKINKTVNLFYSKSDSNAKNMYYQYLLAGYTKNI